VSPSAVLLVADNFTPPSRTPWGGHRLLRGLKKALPLAPEKALYPVVGESWELSVEPDFPSVCDDGAPLARRLREDPVGWLGREARRDPPGTALLVKLLDADDELSVQIHPDDHFPGLGPGECGKPESWYVVSAEPGAGLYLGLAEGVTRDTLEPALRRGDDLSGFLGWTPVEPGDFLLIEAGTVHAIGRGLTMVEPQKVLPGRRGITYRYWDWNRRYDPAGRLDPKGSPRALHVTEALAVTRWDAPRGERFLAGARARAGAPSLEGPARLEALCGERAALRSEHLQVARLHGTGSLEAPPWGALVALTVLEGAVAVRQPEGALVVPRGRTAALPAGMERYALDLVGAHAVLSAVY
jgi:mannose-6-phosphate isomerase